MRNLFNLALIGPAVHRNNIISILKPTRCAIVSNLFYFGMTLYMFRTIFTPIIRISRLYFFSVALQPNAGHGLLILQVSRSHTTTLHRRWDSSGRVISSSQRPLPDNTQHSQLTNIHAPGGIRTHNLSRRAAADLRLRPRGYWDRLKTVHTATKQTLLSAFYKDTTVCLLANSQQCLFDKCLLLYVQSSTPDDGRKDRPKHVDCHSKIK